jgi:acyl-CoA thioester hydrolase
MSAAPFSTTLIAGWAACDVNGHMRNSAYLDMASDSRMLFFAAHGFAPSDFARLGIGPVVKSDVLEYFREVRLLEPVRIEFRLAGMSDDASRLRLRNDFLREDGVLAARLTSQVGWLDLAARRLCAAPGELLQRIMALGRTDDFESLPSSVRRE